MPTLVIHGLILTAFSLIAWMVTGGLIYSYVEQKHTAAQRKRIYRWTLLSAAVATILTLLTLLRFLIG